MTEDITIDELKELAISRVDIASLPTDFIGKVKKYEKRQDKRGRDALFLTVTTDNGDVVFKYTRLHFGDLAQAMEKMKVRSLSELVGKKVRFVVRPFRIGNPRHIPMEVIE